MIKEQVYNLPSNFLGKMCVCVCVCVCVLYTYACIYTKEERENIKANMTKC